MGWGRTWRGKGGKGGKRRGKESTGEDKGGEYMTRSRRGWDTYLGRRPARRGGGRKLKAFANHGGGRYLLGVSREFVRVCPVAL